MRKHKIEDVRELKSRFHFGRPLPSHRWQRPVLLHSPHAWRSVVDATGMPPHEAQRPVPLHRSHIFDATDSRIMVAIARLTWGDARATAAHARHRTVNGLPRTLWWWRTDDGVTRYEVRYGTRVVYTQTFDDVDNARAAFKRGCSLGTRLRKYGSGDESSQALLVTPCSLDASLVGVGQSQ